MVRLWTTAFQKLHPHVRVEVPPPYSNATPPGALLSGKIGCAFIARELRPSEIEEFRKKWGYPPTCLPVCGGSFDDFGFMDAAVVIVNRQNPLRQATLQQMDAVFSKTRQRGYPQSITTWGQLGLTGEWTDKPIHVWGLAPWNAAEEFVRQRILCAGDRRGEWRDGMNFSKEGVGDIALKVQEDPYAIGYCKLATVNPSVRGLALAEVPGGPFFRPSYEDVAKARYPLSRLIYAELNLAPGRPADPAVVEFVRFILSREGQQLVLDQGVFLPLRSEQVAEGRRLLGR